MTEQQAIEVYASKATRWGFDSIEGFKPSAAQQNALEAIAKEMASKLAAFLKDES